MQAMVQKKLGTALEWTDLADRQPGQGEILVKVAAGGAGLATARAAAVPNQTSSGNGARTAPECDFADT